MAKNKRKFKPKNEFRFNRKTNHNTYIFGDDGKNYKALGITHKDKTFGKNNMPLANNPQKGKSEKAYIRNGIISDTYSHFDKPKKNFGFSNEDFSNVKSKIRNYKNRQKKRNKKTSG